MQPSDTVRSREREAPLGAMGGDGDEDIGRLVISCPDRPGIVSAVTRFLFQRNANIIESQQYSTDPFGGVFFLRVGFYLPDLASHLADLERDFSSLARSLEMSWRVTGAAKRKRVGIMVSKAGHTLQELLWRTHAGELSADIRMVISNHPDLEETVARWGIPFHHIPVSKESRSQAETTQLSLLAGEVDLVVLAGYMQILSGGFLAEFPNRVINIHHSFLPAFVGANPYDAAAERGVKLVGATAHYATEELDAGPIIEQDVVRVDHRHTVEDLRRRGRHVERAVLARAVGWDLEDRVIVYRNQTVVFS